MRKTCRWLGCAALLCFTAVELSGCTSKPLISGMKWPGRQDRDSALALTDKNLAAKNLTAEEPKDLLAQAREFELEGNYPQATRAYKDYLNSGGQPLAQDRRVSSSQDGKTDTKTTARESQELLAQAREHEKAGDFPKATQAYREYLSGGESDKPNRSTPSESVAKTQTKPLNRPAEIDGTDFDEKPPVRQTAKINQPATDHLQTVRKPVATEDPWADEPVGRPHSEALPVIKPNPTSRRPPPPNTAQTKKQTLLDEDSAPAEELAWADTDSSAEPVADDETLASGLNHPPSGGLSEEDLEELLDLDEGEIDWGDAPPSSNTIASEETLTTTAEDSEEPVTESPSELPLVDLNADESQSMAPPELEDELASESATGQDAWHSHEPGEEPTDELAVADVSEMTLPSEDEFSPPVLTETEAEPESVEPESSDAESAALSCKDCEPWLYAQVMKLGSQEADIRKQGLLHLADMGSTGRQAGLAVRVLLQDSDPLVQAHAAWALWVIENDPWDSVGTLRPLLDHSNTDVVELACYMLGDIGVQAESATDALELLRDHAGGTTCIHAAEALIRIHGVEERSLAVLTTAIKSRGSEERWISAVALGRCRGTKSAGAVTALTAALNDVDPEVRSAAALSLGGLGQDALIAQPELERVACMDDPQVQDAARAALACLKR